MLQTRLTGKSPESVVATAAVTPFQTTFKRPLNDLGILHPVPPLPDEAGDVDVDEGGHEVLAVEPVHDAAVTRDGVGKILKQVQEKKKKKKVEKKSVDKKRKGKSPGRLTRRRWAAVWILLTLILKALLKPLAKKPPKGPMMEAKEERAMLWIWKG